MLLGHLSACLLTAIAAASPSSGFIAQDLPALLTGRVVAHANHTALVDVLVQVSGMVVADGTGGVTVRRWNGGPVKTDAHGTFRVEVASPDLRNLTIALTADGFAPLEFGIRVPAAGETITLGDISLQKAARIVGHVLDEDGELLLDGWTVRAMPTTFAVRQDRAVSLSMRPAVIDPVTGTFQLDGLLPGTYEVTARGPGGLALKPVVVEAAAGVTTEVEVIAAGLRRNRILEVDLQLEAPTELGPTELVVRTPSGAPLSLSRATLGRWVAITQEDGEHSLVIEDPRYERAEALLRGGELVNLPLKGAASIELEVVDPATGAEVADYGVALRYPAASWRTEWRRTVLQPGAARAPEPHRFHVVPGEVELAVWSADRPMVLAVEDLLAGDVRRLRVELAGGFELQGRVVDSLGAPVSGAQISFTRGEVYGHDQPSSAPIVLFRSGMPEVPIPAQDIVATAGADGVFAVPNFAPGRWAVYVTKGPYVRAATVIDIPRDGRCELTLPAHTEVRIELSELRGDAAQRCELRLESVDSGAPLPLGLRVPAVSADGDGRFPTVHVPLGRVRVELYEPRGTSAIATQQTFSAILPVEPCGVLRLAR